MHNYGYLLLCVGVLAHCEKYGLRSGSRARGHDRIHLRDTADQAGRGAGVGKLGWLATNLNRAGSGRRWKGQEVGISSP